MGAIALEGVSKSFGDVVAVDDVDLTVGDGGFHCLLGPNGSGKTTLLRLCVGLARPSAGTIDRSTVRLGCGFQTPNFYPGLTVAENLRVFAGLVDGPGEDWRDTLVDSLGLDRALGRRAGDLSGGFARKLDLALALLKRPSVLLLDEPLGALDDVSKVQLVGFLDHYASTHGAVLVSTHQVTSFADVVDRVTVMHDGAVIKDGPPPEAGTAESLQEYYVDMVLAREDARPTG